jgi:hypothetical protein
VLTEQTKQSIAQAFDRAARTSLVREPGDLFEIASADSRKSAEQPGEKLLVITISSFVFRLLTIFRIAENPAIRTYYVRGGADRTVTEAFAELANLCCGALSREMSGHFPHLAMSIPYTLNSRCMALLGELKPQYLSSYQITINESVRLQATLCMCCYAPVDIPASSLAVEAGSGELQLF